MSRGEPGANAPLKKKWVEALRSGKYEQGRYTLKRDNQYCCLGVACVVARCGFYYSELGSIYDLGDAVEGALMEMNDSEGKTFVEIADWIEAHDLRTGEPLSSSSDEVAAPPTSMEIEK